MKSIDINADLGEECGDDVALLKHITSANVACGFHGGGARTMAALAATAKKLRVAVGAHVSYPDRENFGRRSMNVPPAEIETIVAYQIGAMAAFSKLRHVKLHGALYHDASRDPDIARAVARAISNFDGRLRWIAMPETQQARAAIRSGITFAAEGFADRAYRPDGSLVPRSEVGALITDARAAVEQVLKIAPGVDTICIHSDTPNAVELAGAVRAALTKAGYRVRPLA